MITSDATDHARSEAPNVRQTESREPAMITQSAPLDTCARLVAREALIDYKAWVRQQGRPFNECEDAVISIANVEAVARAQNVRFMTGDVLTIRSGFVDGKSDLWRAS